MLLSAHPLAQSNYGDNSFLGGFFCIMVVPQDLIHFNLLSSSASLLDI
jgi:hypothetical protein